MNNSKSKNMSNSYGVMDDTEADATANDIKLYAEAILLAIQEEKFGDVAEYVTKIKNNLDKISLYAERKKVAF